MESSQSLELQRHIRVAVVPLGNTSEYAVAAVQHHLSLVGFPLAHSVRRRPVMLQDIPDFEIYTTRFKSRENEHLQSDTLRRGRYLSLRVLFCRCCSLV